MRRERLVVGAALHRLRPAAAWAVIDHLRTPPELGPIQRKPRAYNWEKEQETW